ncbi:hypothetical protein SAMN02949497_4505 [Methylomagnum ishizawai]|uniref:Uncharacterized protein n=1 Tax=Methylomagnum ishizawai TaxID=1760988 RepID=A0A1Y6D3A9_9GAMM|nr:hypothetical protein [Methylomagnum ishizawai]SMF97086.1 hypothetical protein SAMN02949497_4505 [Methylomagnum ishizawai]
MATTKALAIAQQTDSATLLLGTGLAFASLILLPAFATRLGLDAVLTGAVRIALMRASSRVVSNKNQGDAVPASFDCH